MTQTRIGIIGLGVISRFYVDAFDELPSLILTAVCDLKHEVLEPFRDRVACYTSHRVLLAQAAVDAVVVNVPNDVHASVCRDVIEAGLPVCVEKPLAISVEQGRELTELARERDVTLFTSFHRRYNANVLRLLRSIPSDRPIRSLTVRYLERIEEHAGPDRWYLNPVRCGGGCVVDNGPNAFDLVRLFLGDLTLEDADVQRDGDDVDRVAMISLRTKGGAVARVELDWRYPGEVKDVTVQLADGTQLYADMLAGYPDFKGSLPHEYVRVLEDFTFAMASGQDRSADGLAALELVDAVYRCEARIVATPRADR